MTATSESWETRIQRAEELARKSEATKEILTFYAKLFQSQKEVDGFPAVVGAGFLLDLWLRIYR